MPRAGPDSFYRLHWPTSPEVRGGMWGPHFFRVSLVGPATLGGVVGRGFHTKGLRFSPPRIQSHAGGGALPRLVRYMTLAGLEPAIFGSEDQRLIH